MGTKRMAPEGRAPIEQAQIGVDTDAIDHAVHLIHQVCCFTGPFDLIEEYRDQELCAAVEAHDTGALFDRLIYTFSFQGFSDEIAINYMAKQGRATWGVVGNVQGSGL